jgi:hypothetical protein
VTPATSPAERRDTSLRRLGTRWRILLLVGLLGASAAAIGLLTEDGDSASRAAGLDTPRAVSVAGLREFAASIGHVVYWAGPRAAGKLELTQTRKGYVFVRYLPAGVAVGSRKPTFLTIATYPSHGAHAAAVRAAHAKGMVKRAAPRGGVAVWSGKRPTSVYLSYPGSDYLVEVFSPRARQAQHLVLSGAVTAVQ